MTTSSAGISFQLQSQRTGVRADWRNFRLAAVLLLALSGMGCGDTFRPVALPIAVPSPAPAATHFVASLSSNGDNVLNATGSCSPSGTPPPCIEDPGAVSRIDVSGDSISSIAHTGLAPVHAAFLPNGSKVYVANSGEDTISSIATTSATSATTVSLPQLCNAGGCVSSVPVFVTSTENGKMYVANSGNGTVSVINSISDVVVNTVALDPLFAGSPLPAPNPTANPIALAELPNGSKLYSVNRGNKTVTSISTVDDTFLTNIVFVAPPIWAVASSDSRDLYVLSSTDISGTISVIDTLSDTVVNTISVGAGSNFMLLDSVANRLYVTNPAAATVSIFDVAGSVLTPHAGTPITITAALGSGCSSAPMPSSVTVLHDGNRAYVASFQADPSGAVCTQATVINTLTGAVSSVIPLSQSTDMSAQTGCNSARFRVFAAASGGGANSNFKVYVSQCDAGSVAVIETFSSSTGANQHPADVLGATLSAPLSGFTPLLGHVNPPFQNPVFVVAGP
jgi:DNA-binding beta-propeller fold protein YncE